MSPSSIPPRESLGAKSSLGTPEWSVTERVYSELRRLAELKLQRGPKSPSLQATMLVNEAWLRLRETPDFEGKEPGHYVAAAAQAMRWIVVDQARKRKAARLGTLAGQQIEDPAIREDEGILALSQAMERLKASFPAEAEVAELRYFTGLSIEETAAAIGASPATIKRRWAFARAWLTSELGPKETEDS